MTTSTCSRAHASELVTRTRAVGFEERSSDVHSGGRERREGAPISGPKLLKYKGKKGREFRDGDVQKVATANSSYVHSQVGSRLSTHAGARRLARRCCQGNELQQRGLSPAVLDVAPWKGEVTRNIGHPLAALPSPSETTCWVVALFFASRPSELRLTTGSPPWRTRAR